MEERLGHYRIVEHLGSGAMGAVYLADDTRLKRKVALKILPPELAADPERLHRFRREAQALAALNHPNIVTVHSVEAEPGPEDGEEIHFLTMEHVEGTTLDKTIPKHGLEARRFFELAVPLAEAVATAHDRGIIHRDLKPANVMIGADGLVKVVDFGLAKTGPETASGTGPEDTTLLADPTLTHAGTLLGTFPYMSPEQLEGKPADGRSDVFSLGAVLYEMATGRRPFKAATQASLITAIMSETPSEIDALRADLPHHLARIIRHCLEKDPSHRFQTARDVANELVDLRDELFSSSQRQPHSKASGPAISKWLPAAIGGAVILVGLGVGGLALWRLAADSPTGPTTRSDGSAAFEPSAAADAVTRIAVLPFEHVGAAANDFIANGITDEITSRLAAVGGLAVVSRTSARHYTGTQKRLEEIARELGVGYVLEGSVLTSRSGDLRVAPALVRAADGIQLWSEVYDRAGDELFKVQSEIAQKVVFRLGVALLDSERAKLRLRPTDNLTAYQAYLKGHHYAGQPHFSVENWEQVIESYSRAVELDPDFALAWAQLAHTHARFYYLFGDRSEARANLARAAVARASELAPHAAEVHLARGYTFMWVEGDTERALDEIRLAESGLPNSAELLTAKGMLLRMHGRWNESQRAWERAFELSPRDPAIALELAYAFWPTRQHELALAACERTIALSPDPNWQAWAHLTNAFNYWTWKGSASEARAALEFVPIDHSWAPWSWFWQEVLEGKTREALARLDTFPGGWVRTKIVARPAALLAAMLQDALGEHELAREAWAEARAHLEAALESAPDDPRLHSSLGIALAGLGLRDGAAGHGRRAVELFPLSKDAFYGIPYVLDLAFIHTLLGEDDAGIDQLELLLRQPSWLSPAFLEADPRWDRLRGNPRFIGLLAGTES